MKTEKTITWLIAITMLLATVLSASATLNGIAILTPTASTNFQGSAATCRAEVNITGLIGNANATNVSFRASTDTSYSTELCVDNILANTTDTASCTCDTTTLTAGKNNFVAVLYNGTNQINSTATSVVVDNTAPSRVNVLPLATPKFMKAISVQCDSNDAIYNASIAATGYVLNWTTPDGTNVTARGVTSAEFAKEDFVQVGTYTLTCDVKDSGNNTARDTKFVNVGGKDKEEVTITGVTRAGGKTNTKMIMLFVGLIVVIGGVAIMVAVMSGGKKRRR